MVRRLCFVVMLGCILIGVVLGNANATSEKRKVASFRNIEISGCGSLIISQGESESLLIETDARLLDYVKTTVTNGTLHLYLDREIRPIQGLVYRLVVKNLKVLSSSGSVDVKGNGNLYLEQLVLNASGGSTIKLILNSDKVDSSISGASKLELSGRAKHHKILLSGASKFIGVNFLTKSSNMHLNGASEAEVYATVTCCSLCLVLVGLCTEGIQNISLKR